MRRRARGVPETGFHFDGPSHSYYFDGRPMTGCTTILGVLAKPALIPWAAKMAVEYIREHAPGSYEGHDGEEPQGEFTYAVSEALLEEAKGAHAKKRDTAADAGTELHAKVERYILRSIDENNGYPAFLHTDEGAIVRFANWASKEGIRFIASEIKLYSKELWVAGTADFVFEKDGKRFVGDIKTYKKIWDRVPLIQCAGYAYMLCEMENAQDLRRAINGEADLPEKLRTVDGYCVVCLPKERAFNPEEDVLWSYDTEGDREAFLSAVRLYRYLNQK